MIPPTAVQMLLQGIDHLKNGSCERAVAAFRLAIKDVLPRVAMKSEIEETHRDNILFESISLRHIFDSNQQFNAECSSYSLFDCVILPPSKLADPDESAAASESLYIPLSAALLYNMAFVFHVSGLRKCSGSVSQERDISHALRLYDMAIDLLDNENCHNPLIQLAALNNAGHCHMILQDAQRMGEYIASLRIVLACGMNMSGVRSEECALFQWNAILLDIRCLQVAAAAAA